MRKMKEMKMKDSKRLKRALWILFAVFIIAVAVGVGLRRQKIQTGSGNIDKIRVDSLQKNTGKSVKKEREVFLNQSGDQQKSPKIQISGNKAYLIDTRGNVIFGPCDFIYDDFGYANGDGIFRYVDSENGLIGYGKYDDRGVSVLLAGRFSKASKMADGSACVKENEEYYYIDREGKRFTFKKYLHAHPFGETQGCYARVHMPDGSWSVINQKEDVIIGGFDSINKLYGIYLIGTGVKNGKAVLFTLENSDGVQPGIIKEYPDCTEITEEPEGTDIATVTNEKGEKGIICIWNGEIVVPVKYNDIQWGFMDMSENVPGEKRIRWFRCEKEDGTYDVKYWRF